MFVNTAVPTGCTNTAKTAGFISFASNNVACELGEYIFVPSDYCRVRGHRNGGLSKHLAMFWRVSKRFRHDFQDHLIVLFRILQCQWIFTCKSERHETNTVESTRVFFQNTSPVVDERLVPPWSTHRREQIRAKEGISTDRSADVILLHFLYSWSSSKYKGLL